MTAILGLNAYHADSSAALIIDGKLVAAAEEERFTRIKHWAGVPTGAIKYCLKESNLSLGDVDFIAVNQGASRNVTKKIVFVLRHRPSISKMLDKLRTKRNRRNFKLIIEEQLGEKSPCEIIHIDHHLAHLSSAFHVSPYSNALVVSVDGFGDFASAAWGIGNGTKISLIDRVYFPYSLGTFYQAMTQYLGFSHYGDEYKVMGLAPYGKPGLEEKVAQLVKLLPSGKYELNLDYFRQHKERVDFNWDGGEPKIGTLFSENLTELFGPPRGEHDELNQYHMDIAWATQHIYERAFFHLIHYRSSAIGECWTKLLLSY